MATSTKTVSEAKGHFVKGCLFVSQKTKLQINVAIFQACWKTSKEEKDLNLISSQGDKKKKNPNWLFCIVGHSDLKYKQVILHSSKPLMKKEIQAEIVISWILRAPRGF